MGLAGRERTGQVKTNLTFMGLVTVGLYFLLSTSFDQLQKDSKAAVRQIEATVEAIQ